jgi:hypothetical protein
VGSHRQSQTSELRRFAPSAELNFAPRVFVDLNPKYYEHQH